MATILLIGGLMISSSLFSPDDTRPLHIDARNVHLTLHLCDTRKRSLHRHSNLPGCAGRRGNGEDRGTGTGNRTSERTGLDRRLLHIIEAGDEVGSNGLRNLVFYTFPDKLRIS